MQITLNQSEIEKAIITYVGNQGISITGNVDVTLIAGRAPNGMSATIEISNDAVHSPATLIPRTVKGATVLEVAHEPTDTPEEPAAPVEEVNLDRKPLFGQ